jgi:hypothetical protein
LRIRCPAADLQSKSAERGQVGVGFVAFRRLAGVGFLIDRHQSHKAHQSPDALFVHGMTLVLQVPCHLPDTVKRGVQELLVDQQHQVEVHRGFALRRVIER